MLGHHSLHRALGAGMALASLACIGALVVKSRGLVAAAAPPIVAIIAPADGTTIAAGESIALSADAIDFEEGDVSATITWRSDKDGPLGAGPELIAVGLSEGTHVITASATNSGGMTGETSITLHVIGGTLQLTAVADAYVGSDLPDTNFGTATTLQADASPTRQAFMRFLVSGTTGLVIDRAILQLTVSTASASDSESGGTLHALTDTGWSEEALTWNTRPPIDGPALGTQGPVLQDQLVEFDVTSAVAGDGSIVFALTTGSGDAVKYKSRETASGRPKLLLTLRSPQVADQRPHVTITAPADGTIVAPGAPVTLTATADDAEDGDLTAAVAWSSSVSGPLGTGSPLLLAGLPAGAHTIRATVTDILGQSAEAAIDLVVGTVPLVAILAPADGTTIVAGESVALAADAIDPVEGDVSHTIGWRSDREGPLGAGAELIALDLSPGTHAITAAATNSTGVTGEAHITLHVVSATMSLTAVADTYIDSSAPDTNFGAATTLQADVSPPRQVFMRFLVSGTTGLVIDRAFLQLTVSTASASDSDRGGTLRTLTDTGWSETALTWNTRPPIDGPALGTLGPVLQGQLVEFDVTSAVRGDGSVVFALTNGSSDAVKYKSRETASDRPKLLLSLRSSQVADQRPSVSITAPADGTIVAPGTPVTLIATAADPEDGDLTAAVAWSSSLSGPLGTGSPLPLAGLPPGTHTIRAAVTDHVGQAAEAEIGLVVNTPPAVTITSPADGTIVAEGTPLTLAGTAADAEQGDVSASITWTSSAEGPLGSGPSLVVGSLSPGAHTLTATARDALGGLGSASVGVVVRTGTLSVPAVADAFVAADQPGTNFGRTKTLVSDASPERIAFFRFAVSGLGGIQPDSARLRLTVSGASGSPSNSGGTLRSLTDTGWSEATLTYSNRPVVDGPALGTAGAVTAGQVLEFDVTPAVRGDGTYAFALVTASSDGVGYLSREATSGAPQLVLIAHGLPSDPPTLGITAPPDGTTVALGAQLALTGVASDPEEGDLSALIQWSSDRDGALGQGGTIAVSSLSAGPHVITARVADSNGGMASAMVSIGVTGGTLTLAPVADASVKADAPNSNYGTSTALEADASPIRRFYMRFRVPDLAGLRVTQATLRLTVRTTTGAGSDAGGSVHHVTTTPWEESTVTFNTSPPIDGGVLAAAGPVVEGQVVDFDVTTAVTGPGTHDFALESPSDNKVEYYSREKGTTGPRLILVVE